MKVSFLTQKCNYWGPLLFDRNLRMKRNENVGVDCSQGIEELMQNNGFRSKVIIMNWN